MLIFFSRHGHAGHSEMRSGPRVCGPLHYSYTQSHMNKLILDTILDTVTGTITNTITGTMFDIIRDVLENEQHFICECDAYGVDREILYSVANMQDLLFNSLCQDEQFTFLLTHCWQATAKFIRKAWLTRQAKMYTLSIYHCELLPLF